MAMGTCLVVDSGLVYTFSKVFNSVTRLARVFYFSQMQSGQEEFSLTNLHFTTVQLQNVDHETACLLFNATRDFPRHLSLSVQKRPRSENRKLRTPSVHFKPPYPRHNPHILPLHPYLPSHQDLANHGSQIHP